MEGKPMEGAEPMEVDAEPEPEPEPMDEDVELEHPSDLSSIIRRNLIQFHMRSDVFSTQPVWVEATRELHLNWKDHNLTKFKEDKKVINLQGAEAAVMKTKQAVVALESKPVRPEDREEARKALKDARVAKRVALNDAKVASAKFKEAEELRDNERTDCTIMSLALLGWPHGVIKEYQLSVINSHHRKAGTPVDELQLILANAFHRVKDNITIGRFDCYTKGQLMDLYSKIWENIYPGNGIIVLMFERGEVKGHAVVMAKDPHGNEVIFDAQNGVQTANRETPIVWGRLGFGTNETKEMKRAQRDFKRHNDGREMGRIEFFANLLFDSLSDIIIPMTDGLLNKVYSWDYSGEEPIIVEYDSSKGPVRPEDMPTLKEQFSFLGPIEGNGKGYKLKSGKSLPRGANDPVFFGKRLNQGKSRKDKDKKPKRKSGKGKSKGKRGSKGKRKVKGKIKAKGKSGKGDRTNRKKKMINSLLTGTNH